MSTTKREELNTQQNAEETNTSSKNYLHEIEAIENSPYKIVGSKEKGYMITFGRYAFAKDIASKLDAILYLEQNKYDIILKTILAVINEHQEEIEAQQEMEEKELD